MAAANDVEIIELFVHFACVPKKEGKKFVKYILACKIDAAAAAETKCH